MELKEGFLFTGKWFKGKVLVKQIINNDLKVRLQSNLYDTEEDYWWFETWNLEHTILGFQRGDYFKIPTNNG